MLCIIFGRCQTYIISLKNNFVIGFNLQHKNIVANLVNISCHLVPPKLKSIRSKSFCIHVASYSLCRIVSVT